MEVPKNGITSLTQYRTRRASQAVISTIKTSFYNAYIMYDLDIQTLDVLAQMAQVEPHIVRAMFHAEPVHRLDAEKVCRAFAEYTGEAWSLDNMQVALYPTLSDICKQYRLDINTLTLQFDKIDELPFCCFDMMLENTPVLASHATIVLDTISTYTNQHYGLENVDVALLEQGGTQ